MDLIGGLIWVVIVLVFVVPWIRGAVQQLQGGAPVRPGAGNPRGLAESGGYRAPEPGPVDQALVRGPARSAAYQEEPEPETIRRAPRNEPARSPEVSGVDADRIRRQMQNPQNVRTAILLKELLDPPVSIR